MTWWIDSNPIFTLQEPPRPSEAKLISRRENGNAAKQFSERLEDQQNLQLNVQNPLPPSLCLSHRWHCQGCGHGGRNQSESRHTALQRGLCKLWCPKNVANIIIVRNGNTLCLSILGFNKMLRKITSTKTKCTTELKCYVLLFMSLTLFDMCIQKML